jgi:hypothetical protein
MSFLSAMNSKLRKMQEAKSAQFLSLIFHRKIVLCSLLVALTICFYSQKFPFFWDSIQLGSKHAHFFYQNGLKWAILPPDIDSGHHPVFGYYLALCWTLFGKSLAVSHWAMFPFLFGIPYFTFRIAEKKIGIQWAFWLLPMVLLDPVLLGQMVMVSPDVCLLCFFLMALNSILYLKEILFFQKIGFLREEHEKDILFSEKIGCQVGLMLGILGLCLISMRGMMVAASLGAYMCLEIFLEKEKSNYWEKFKKVLPFAPGYFAGLLFLIWHKNQVGWIGFHPNSSWAPAFQSVDFQGFKKNILVLGWRFLDFGRVGVWLILLWVIIRQKRHFLKKCLFYTSKIFKLKNQIHAENVSSLGVLFIVCCIFLLPSALLYFNLSSHRYFLVLFWLLHFLVIYWIVKLNLSDFKKKIALTLIAISLATGNLWINPIGISMDWDATLAHVPYHQARTEMLDFIALENIKHADIGTSFPNYNLTAMTDLKENGKGLFSEKDFSKNNYILWSNVFNDFSKEEYELLKNEWKLVKTVEKRGVLMQLFERKP